MVWYASVWFYKRLLQIFALKWPSVLRHCGISLRCLFCCNKNFSLVVRSLQSQARSKSMRARNTVANFVSNRFWKWFPFHGGNCCLRLETYNERVNRNRAIARCRRNLFLAILSVEMKRGSLIKRFTEMGHSRWWTIAPESQTCSPGRSFPNILG